MNRLQIRQQFRQMSGRFDLVNEDGSNNGADFYIDSGMKWLDRRVETKKSPGRVFRVVPSGTYAVTFPYCRAIKEVWAATGRGRWQLELKPIQDIRAQCSGPETPWPSGGDPLYYAPAFLRAVTETDRTAVADFESAVGYTDIMVGENYEYNGVIFIPSTGDDTLIEVWGYFYTQPMEADGDQNYWSVVHPDILVMAALRQVEVFNRNTQGRQDWESAITDMLADIDKDEVEQDITGADQMEG